MGFEKFLSDDDFESPIKYGSYISDIEIYNKVKEIIEKEEKSFISCSTMGTHSPFGDFTKEECDEWVEVEGLTAIENGRFNNYVQKIRNLDNMIGKILDYVSKSDENTLVIMYGDHYPSTYDLYEALNMIPKKERNISPEKYSHMFKTPYMVFSNCNDIKVNEKITPNEMGTYILENVRLEKKSWLYKALYSCVKNKSNEHEYNTYLLLQYDEIFGEKFWEK